jgi:hypothetical protein
LTSQVYSTIAIPSVVLQVEEQKSPMRRVPATTHRNAKKAATNTSPDLIQPPAIPSAGVGQQHKAEFKMQQGALL